MNKIAYATILPLSLALFGCGQSSTSSTTNSASSSASAATTSTTATASSAATSTSNLPKVTVATTGKGIPLTYKDAQGALDGIELEIVREIGKQQGFQPEFVQAQWQDLFDGVETGRYDIAISNISYTPERAAKFGLSESHLFNPTMIVYNPKVVTNPKTLSDLKNIKVSIMKGTSSEKMLTDAGFKNLMIADSSVEAKANFLQGKADAYLGTKYTFGHTQHNYKQVPMATFPLEDENSPSAKIVMVVNKNKPELLNQLNAGIKALKAGNKIDEISEKHYKVAVQ